MEKNISIQYTEYTCLKELDAPDQELLSQAIRFAESAYAPYSFFKVGAAIRLQSGKIVGGNNQENAVYPTGLCAERVAVFAAGANFPNDPVDTIAVTAINPKKALDHPVPPCGSCRQALVEYQERFKNKIRVILRGESGKILVFNGLENLLPFPFDSKELF